MTHWRSFQEKEFLGHWSLEKDGKTRDVTVTIRKVGGGLVKSTEKPRGDKCIVLHFERVPKPMVCNTTNAKIIESLYGSDVEGWVGKAITLYATDVPDPKRRGATVKGLRVRPFKPAGAGSGEEIVDEPEEAREPGGEG